MSAPAKRAIAGCDACGARAAQWMDDGGVHLVFCRECDEEICSGCAAVFDVDGGYGPYGQDVRVYALCKSCAAEGR